MHHLNLIRFAVTRQGLFYLVGGIFVKLFRSTLCTLKALPPCVCDGIPVVMFFEKKSFFHRYFFGLVLFENFIYSLFQHCKPYGQTFILGVSTTPVIYGRTLSFFQFFNNSVAHSRKPGVKTKNNHYSQKFTSILRSKFFVN